MSIIATIRAGIERIGWSETARRSGVNRSLLHRDFGAGTTRKPNLRTIEAVLPVLGLELTIGEKR